MVAKKRVFTALLCVFMLLSLIAAPTMAADGWSLLQLTRCSVNLPDVQLLAHVFDSAGNPINIDGDSPAATCFFDGEQLLLKQTISAADADKYICILCDVSTSARSTIAQTKKDLKRFAADKPENVHIVLFTFGEQVNVLLDGEETDEDIIAAIETITADDEETRMYEAVDRAAKLIRGSENASIAAIFMITDAAEYISDTSLTKDEAMGQISAFGLPIFTYALGNTNSSSRSELGKISRSTNAVSYSAYNLSVKSALTEMLKYLCKGMCFYFESSSNYLSSAQYHSCQLTLTVGENELQERVSILGFSQKDNTEPKIDEVKIEDGEMKLFFSENVVGVDKDSFIIKGKVSGKQSVKSVTYDKDSCSAVISFSKKMYNDTYSISAQGITDASVEKNPLNGQTVYQYQLTGNKRDIKYLLTNWWWVPLAILLVVVAVVLLKNRSEKDKMSRESAVDSELESNVQHRIRHNLPTNDSINVQITIIDNRNLQRVVDISVGSGFIIGRTAQLCDLSIDDSQLSRQHFALYYENGSLFVKDLNSTNHTFVNSAVLRDYVVLRNKDIINAGNTKFIVSFEV